MALAPRAVYVHVPFCRSLCGYCDFYSVIPAPGAGEPLVDALLSELELRQHRERIRAETIFVGGGTPTVLEPRALERLLAALRELAPDGAPSEFTVEANPATVTPDVAEVLAGAGVTRVSIGAQSFDPADLRVLQRTHEPPQVGQTVAVCRDAGLDDINLDLIFAIPGQTLDRWRGNIDAALALEPTHLSCYSLTFEPGTRLHEQLEAGRVQRLDADLDAAMYELAIDMLAAAGLEHYEISNFARPGRRCRHNLVYWHNQPYVGIGPSGAGFVAGVRYKNVSDVAAYVAAIRAGRLPEAEREQRDADQQARESAMLGLRLVEGLDRAAFAERFGRDPTAYFAHAVARHVERGLLEVTPEKVRLTRAGLLLADTVVADFL